MPIKQEHSWSERRVQNKGGTCLPAFACFVFTLCLGSGPNTLTAFGQVGQAGAGQGAGSPQNASGASQPGASTGPVTGRTVTTGQTSIGASPQGSQNNNGFPGAARTVSAMPATLSLEQAISIALDNNVSTLLAREGIRAAQGQARQLLSNLLPRLSANSFQESRTINLAAQGLTGFGPFMIPPFVGPFNSFDARLSLAQSLFDLSAIRDLRGGRAGVRIAELEVPLAREQVAAAVAISYLAVLRDDRVVAAAQADLELAQALLKLAQDQQAAGVATGIDVVRAQTSVAQQRVRLLEAQSNAAQSRLVLERVVGLPQGGALNLVDPLRFQQEAPLSAEGAIATAQQNRYEIKIAEEQLRQRQLEFKARVAEQYPSFGFFGDYGDSGNLPDRHDLPTRTYGVQLSVPIFNGGLTRGRIEVASSQSRQANLQLGDTRGQVEEDVRLALVTLRTSAERVAAAEENLTLAQRELTLARDRFAAGVGDNIEVVNAQTSLSDARSGEVTALAQYNSARVNLAAALGSAEKFRF